MEIEHWIIIIAIFTLVFGLYQATDARTLDAVNIDFNSATLAKGYTARDEGAAIVIEPNQFCAPLRLNLTEVNNDELLPDSWRAVSDFFLYDIDGQAPGLLKKPIKIVLKYESNSAGRKALFFFDEKQRRWRELASSVDDKNKTVWAKSPFPYAKIAVFEESPQDLTARAALVIDKKTGKILFKKNAEEVRPLASLTKLVFALVFLENNPGWEEAIEIKKSDYVGGAALWVKEGAKIKVKDLFYASLAGSKNNTVEALVRASGLSKKQFVDLMNEKAKAMGLAETKFVEPTGLDERNVSTAEETIKIAQEAFGKLEILKATTTKWYYIKPIGSKLVYPVRNTSEKVLNGDLKITGSKTGWTNEAGYNLVTQAQKQNHEVIVLILGAKVRKNYEEVYQLLKRFL